MLSLCQDCISIGSDREVLAMRIELSPRGFQDGRKTAVDASGALITDAISEPVNDVYLIECEYDEAIASVSSGTQLTTRLHGGRVRFMDLFCFFVSFVVFPMLVYQFRVIFHCFRPVFFIFLTLLQSTASSTVEFEVLGPQPLPDHGIRTITAETPAPQSAASSVPSTPTAATSPAPSADLGARPPSLLRSLLSQSESSASFSVAEVSLLLHRRMLPGSPLLQMSLAPASGDAVPKVRYLFYLVLLLTKLFPSARSYGEPAAARRRSR